MNEDKFRPLNDWLNSIPEPKTFREHFWCLLSDLVDDFLIVKTKFKAFIWSIFKEK